MAELGRKQNIKNEDWIAALEQIEVLVQQESIEKLAAETIAEIRVKAEGQKAAYAWSGGKDSIVVVAHEDKSGDIYGTVTHNRARGTHLLEPMKAIVRQLLGEGHSVEEIGKQIGMKPEEVFRLSDFSREDFLKMMVNNGNQFSKAELYTKV